MSDQMLPGNGAQPSPEQKASARPGHATPAQDPILNNESGPTLSAIRSADPSDFGRHPSKRSIPIEADDALRAKIRLATGVVEHAVPISQLWLAYYHDDYRDNMFQFQTADQSVRDFVGRLLHISIEMLQAEHVTVAGIVLSLILEAVDTHPALRKHMEGPSLHYSRSPADVRAEMTVVSKTLTRLQQELDAALRAEREEDAR